MVHYPDICTVVLGNGDHSHNASWWRGRQYYEGLFQKTAVIPITRSGQGNLPVWLRPIHLQVTILKFELKPPKRPLPLQVEADLSLWVVSMLCQCVTLLWCCMSTWYLFSLGTWLFVEPFLQAYIKDSIKDAHYWPFVRGIHQWLVDSPHKGPVMHEAFACHEVIMGMGQMDTGLLFWITFLVCHCGSHKVKCNRSGISTHLRHRTLK